MNANFSTKILTGIVAVLIILVILIMGVTMSRTDTSEYLENLPIRSAVISGQDFTLYVADTPAAQARGLSYISELPEYSGMIFPSQEDVIPSFWMKDMQMSLDLLWLDQFGEIIDMHENISPDTYPQTYSPITPIRYVIELPAGSVINYSLEVGTVIDFL